MAKLINREGSEGENVRFKTPSEITLPEIFRRIFSKSKYSTRVSFQSSFDNYLKMICQTKLHSKVLKQISDKLIKDPHIRHNKVFINAVVDMISFFEEILVDYKSLIFKSMKRNTNMIIDEIRKNGNNLVLVTSPKLVEEYQKSKINMTSTSKFIYMMEHIISKNTQKNTIISLVSNAEKRGTKIKIGNGDILKYNESLNKIFENIKGQFIK